MKSPFPGMDPYIEASDLWGDFHDSLIADVKRVIRDRLPEGFVARINRRSYIALVEEDEKGERHFTPDVQVTAPRSRKVPSETSSEPASATTTEIEPVTLRAFLSEEFEETFVDIFDLEPERRLVTSIEVLSPSNKKKGSEGWKQYLRKREALLLGKANLVEIDLLRGGTRMPMLDPRPESPYSLLVARKEKAPRCKVWAAYFDRPLSTIPIPLEKPHADIPIDLQALVEAIYEPSRYWQDIDYSKPLDPPLQPEEVAWLHDRLQARDAASKPVAGRKRKSKR